MHQQGLTNNRIMYQQATLKLARSASDQNTVLTYVCLVNDIKPTGHTTNTHNMMHNQPNPDIAREVDTDDEHLKVERSKALHELVESHKKSNEALNIKKAYGTSLFSAVSTSGEDSDTQNEIDSVGNPNILSLTKMKWLSENKDEAPDSSSPSLSPTSSSTSSLSKESQTKLEQHISFSDKYLSTILRLDKEHNLFGLSNLAIVGSRASKKSRKEDDKPVFPQTAIVQICCKGGSCCSHRSNTDLPTSLKCGGCRRCCGSKCPVCVPFPPCCADSCTVPCKKSKCLPCPSSKCVIECQPCSLKIAVNRKPKFEPSPVELTPRSSSVLQKPVAARSCHHLPRCMPPSSCFPYLMPCYWPARAGAPCSNPSRCFHNPPCRAPRKPRSRAPDACPRDHPCSSKKGSDGKCKSHTCPGKIPEFKKSLEAKFSND